MEEIYMSHGTCESNNGPSALELTLAALVDGLRIKNPQLNVKCSNALASMGRNIIKHIRTIERDRATKPPHRQRLSAVSVLIEDTNASDLPGVKTVATALIEAIRVSNPQINSKALMAIRTFPPTIVDEIVRHALKHRKNSGSCTRLLWAVEQLGLPLSGFARMPLLDLALRSNPEIRFLATKILAQSRPGTQGS
jgi:hypothetical protein